LEAAWTKWNFLKFTPGLVGGHCIWVDPYYLVQKAEELWHHPEIITAWRRINDSMWIFVANQVVKQLIKSNISVKWAKVLILGLTFKENVPDFRNSKIADVIKELKEFGVKVSWYDPFYKNLNSYILKELNLKENEIISEIW
jgi:UDP-N-acetyl-D-galactosamine dehydrogenase